jgi:uncharacterized Tic20 family protein
MSSAVACPHCQGQLEADPAMAGQQVACPYCNGAMTMPASSAPLPMAKPAAGSSNGGGGNPYSSPPPSPYAQSPTHQQDVRTWSMLLHLAQLSGFVVPFGSIVVPIIIWQIKKAELPEIDAHGKVVVNWIISGIIYAVVSALLCIVVIGIPMLLALIVLHIVFPIIGGVKASNGELWKYPLSIAFLK